MKLFVVVARDPWEPCASHCIYPGLFRPTIQVQIWNIPARGCNYRIVEDADVAMTCGAGTKKHSKKQNHHFGKGRDTDHQLKGGPIG